MLKTIVEPSATPQINPTPAGPKLPYTMVNTPPNIVPAPPASSIVTNSAPAQNSLIHNKSFVFGVAGVLLLAVGVGAAVLLSSQSQDSRKQAAVEGGPVQISITPTTKTIGVGETSTFTTLINTQGRLISTITVRLSYTYSGSAPLLSASNPTPLIQQQTNTSWNCMIAKTTVAEGKVNIDLACYSSDTTGYSNSTNTPLFSVALTAGQTPTATPIVLAFDPVETRATDKQTGDDIAAIPSSSAAITIAGAAATATPIPSSTPTPSPTAPAAATATPSPTSPTTTNTPTPSPTGQATSTTTPTPTPTNTASSTTNYSCNHTCSANQDCQSDLACLNGYCRDPRCPTDTTCQCQNKNVASESGTSTLPESGGAPYAIWLSILGGLLIFSSINFAILLKRQV